MKVFTKYCQSCHSDRCCIPVEHKLVTYRQFCYDGSSRVFHIAEATSCLCRTDIVRRKHCRILYEKALNLTVNELKLFKL